MGWHSADELLFQDDDGPPHVTFPASQFRGILPSHRQTSERDGSQAFRAGAGALWRPPANAPEGTVASYGQMPAYAKRAVSARQRTAALTRAGEAAVTSASTVDVAELELLRGLLKG